jgi:RNA-directed DNA polymerase
MRRTGHLMEHIADPDNLRLAFVKAARGKQHVKEILEYQYHLEDNLYLLRQQLLSGKPVTGHYRYFTIYEPKERQICASPFSERVLHHALMNICHPVFERVQVFHSYASRPGKGTHKALRLAARYAGQYAWYLKLDIKKFFETVHHGVLYKQLCRLLKDAALLAVFLQIIDSYHATPGRGLPIGNLTSQYFANHFLASLDHYIAERLKASAYIRYMDDMVLWGNSKQELKQHLKAISAFVQLQLNMVLKPPQLNHSHRGLPFLGYKILPQKILLTQRSKQRFIEKIQITEAHYHSGEWTEAECKRRVLPLLAFVQWADSHAFRKAVFLNNKGSSP